MYATLNDNDKWTTIIILLVFVQVEHLKSSGSDHHHELTNGGWRSCDYHVRPTNTG